MGAHPGEVELLLNKFATLALDASGNGTVDLDPDNAWQRWEVEYVSVETDQGNTTPYPTAELFVGPVTSSGNSLGTTASGNRDSFTTPFHVSRAGEMHVVFSGGVAGSTAFVRVRGYKYTKRR